MAGLYIVLDDVAQTFESCELTPTQQSNLQSLISGCRTVLTTLDETLKKHGVLSVKASGLKLKSKKAWERLRWDQAEIVELRAQLTQW